MGSYDSYESRSVPVRSISSSRSSGRGSSRRSSSYSRTTEDATVGSTGGNDNIVRGDTSLPTLVAFGGGLSTARIVEKVTDEVKTGQLKDAINDFLDRNYTDPKDVAIVDAVKDRMTKPDYRVLINSDRLNPNSGFNYHNSCLETKDLALYFEQRSRRIGEGTEEESEEGRQHYNLVDIAIVSHDEGGIEKKL